MDYLTSDKLLIVGAGGMIGSIMTQMSLMMSVQSLKKLVEMEQER